MSNELRQVLQEKEDLLTEASALLQEQESVHAMRLEASLSQKADIEADLEVRVMPSCSLGCSLGCSPSCLLTWLFVGLVVCV